MDYADQGYDEERFKSKVPNDLKCSICLTVLKDPVQCRQNEHYFCRKCITRHLQVNKRTCPICQDDLTVETLVPPSKRITGILSESEISCDHASRGCEMYVQLDTLQVHLNTCHFSPTTCTNDGCSTILNRRDLEHHKSNVCGFRRWKCEDCGRDVLYKNYGVHSCVMKTKISTLEDKVEELTRKNEEMSSTQQEFMREMRNMMTEIKDVMKPLIVCLPREDFIVAGGYDGTSSLDSTEMFCSSTGAWVPLPRLKQGRDNLSSFVYNNHVFVCGGQGGRNWLDTIELMNFEIQEPREWLYFEGKVPHKCCRHSSTIYEDKLITVGGYNENEGIISNNIYETLVNPPYTSNLVGNLPEARCGHGAVLINDDLIIAAGKTTDNARNSLDSIILYNIERRETRVIGNLPYAVSGVAVVSYRSKLIVLGGRDGNRRVLNKVAMFDIVSGRCEMLPDMLYCRAGCSAIISGNVLVVMGGNSEENVVFNSVEAFNLDLSRSWKELPPMSTSRTGATAAVVPSF